MKAIVYNQASHTSLLAACLLKACAAKRIDYTLVDLREHIPLEADSYVFVDVGDASDLKEYFASQIKTSTTARVLEIKEWLSGLDAKSTHFRQVKDVLGGVSNNPGWPIVHKAYEEGDIDSVAFGQLCILLDVCERFCTNTLTICELSSFYSVLTICRKYAAGYADWKSFLNRLLSVSNVIERCRNDPAEHFLKFLHGQKNVNQGLKHKFREIIISNEPFLVFSSLEPEIYNLIRRTEMANRKYIHMSQGLYGTIVMTNHPLGYSLVNEQPVYRLLREKSALATSTDPEIAVTE